MPDWNRQHKLGRPTGSNDGQLQTMKNESHPSRTKVMRQRIVLDLLDFLHGINDTTEQSLRMSSRLNFWNAQMGNAFRESHKERILRMAREEVKTTLARQAKNKSFNEANNENIKPFVNQKRPGEVGFEVSTIKKSKHHGPKSHPLSHYGPALKQSSDLTFPEKDQGHSSESSDNPVFNRFPGGSLDSNSSKRKSESIEDDIQSATVEEHTISATWDDLQSFRDIIVSEIQKEYETNPHRPLQVLLDDAKTFWKQSADQRGLKEETFAAMWLGVLAESRLKWQLWITKDPKNWDFLLDGHAENISMAHEYFSGMDIERSLDV